MLISVRVPYILEYKPGFLFPSQTLETQRENETSVSSRSAFIKHLSIPTARISRKCLAKLTTRSFFQLLSHLYSYNLDKRTSSAAEWAHDCMSMIGHAPYIHYVYVNVSRPRLQLVPSVYSRPGVYLLQSLAYPWLTNETSVLFEGGFYSRIYDTHPYCWDMFLWLTVMLQFYMWTLFMHIMWVTLFCVCMYKTQVVLLANIDIVNIQAPTSKREMSVVWNMSTKS